MAMDMLKRTLELLGGSVETTAKNYMSNGTQLITDAKEVKDSVLGIAKTAQETYKRLTSGRGGIIRVVSNWFYQRNTEYDQYSLDDMDSDDFDSGIKSDESSPEDNSSTATVDVKSAKSIARGLAATSYQIGQKQAELSVANTAELVSTFNNRSAEILTAVNNVNNTLIGLTKQIDKITKVIAYAPEKKDEEAYDRGMVDYNGNVTLGTFARRLSKRGGGYFDIAKMFVDAAVQQGPAFVTDMLVSNIADNIKIGDKTVKDIAGKINYTLGAGISKFFKGLTSSDNPILKFLFGNMKSHSYGGWQYEIENDYTRDKAIFDKMTRKTIVSIIPDYLARITNALTGKNYGIDSKGNVSTNRSNVFVKGMASASRFNAFDDSNGENREAEKQQLAKVGIDDIPDRILREIEGMISFAYAVILMHDIESSSLTYEQAMDENVIKKVIARALRSWKLSKFASFITDDQKFYNVAENLILSILGNGDITVTEKFVNSIAAAAHSMQEQGIKIARSGKGNPHDIVNEMDDNLADQISNARWGGKLSNFSQEEMTAEFDKLIKNIQNGLFGKVNPLIQELDSYQQKMLIQLTERKGLKSGEIDTTKFQEKSKGLIGKPDDQLSDEEKTLKSLLNDMAQFSLEAKKKAESKKSDELNPTKPETSIVNVVNDIYKLLKNDAINVRIVHDNQNRRTEDGLNISPGGVILPGNGDSSMNLNTHGCGPIALADAYNRRHMSPYDVAQGMSRDGLYNPSQGTSVGGYINSASALGMNLHPGQVTKGMINGSSPNNPLTVLGSGYGFGTRNGNNHFMNIIGTAGSDAYISNPMYGGINKFPTDAIVRNSILGLYGSGDGDDITSNADDLVDNLTESVNNLADKADKDSIIGKFLRVIGFKSGITKAGNKAKSAIKSGSEKAGEIKEKGKGLFGKVSDAISDEIDSFKGDIHSRLDDQLEANKRKEQLKREADVYVNKTQDKLSKDGDISERDKQLAQEVLSMMQASLMDGDAKKDISRIQKIIMKIDNKELKQNLNNNVINLMKQSDSPESKPAKSKLGKALFWIFGLAKKFLSPIFKGLKTALTSGFTAIKKYGKNIVSFLAKPYVKAAGQIAYGGKAIAQSIFGWKGKDEQGNEVQYKGLLKYMKEGFKSLYEKFGKPVVEVISKIGNTIKTIGGEIFKAAKKLGGAIGNVFSKMARGIGGLISNSKVVKTVKSGIKKAGTGLTKAVSKTKIGKSFLDTMRAGKEQGQSWSDKLFGVKEKKPETYADKKTEEIAKMLKGKDNSAISDVAKNTKTMSSGVKAVSAAITGGIPLIINAIKDKNKGDKGDEDKTGTQSAEEKKGENAKLKENNGEMGNKASENKTSENKTSSKNNPDNDKIINTPKSGDNKNNKADDGSKAPEGGVAGLFGKMLGGFGLIVKGITSIVTTVMAQTAGFKMIMNLIKTSMKQFVRPIARVMMQIYKAIKPLIKSLTRTLKTTFNVLGEMCTMIIDLVKPVIDMFGKDILPMVMNLFNSLVGMVSKILVAILVPLMPLITKVLIPTISAIGNAVNLILGVVGMGAGYLLKILASIGSIVGGIIKFVSFGLVGGFGSLWESIGNIGQTLVDYGKQSFKDGITGLTDTVASFLGKEDVEVTAEEKELGDDTSSRFVDSTGSSAMDGVIASGDTYNNSSVINNTYGSGNTHTSQTTYGTYMNMSERGCGPVALADSYSRRTGRNVNAGQLAASMSASGNYDSNRGTSVRGFMNTSGAMGMGLTAGGVNNRSLKQASPTNPITVVGSGPGFGTRRGNNHYMNVIGSDGAGHAYVSNPLKGGVSKASINDISSNAIMGLYGAGDVDMNSYGIPDGIQDLLLSLKDLASNFLSMFTGESEVDVAERKANEEASLQQLKRTLGSEEYAKVEQAAFEQFKQDYPKLETETDAAYKARWEKKKGEYITKQASTKLKEKTDSNSSSFETIVNTMQSADESDDWSTIYEAGTNEDRVKEFKEYQESKFGTNNGSSGGSLDGSGSYNKDNLINSAAMIYDAYINTNKNGTYSHELSNKITLRNGRERRIRPDCSGIISAAIQEMGYKIKGSENSAYGIMAAQFANQSSNTVILDSEGNPSSDWTVLPFKKDDLQKGDITANSAHVSLPIVDLDKDYPRGLDGGGTTNIQESARAATAYLNGEENIPWRGAMGAHWNSGEGTATKIIRYIGQPISSAVGGRIEYTDKMKHYMDGGDQFKWHKKQFENSDFHQQAVNAGLSPAEESYVAAIGMMENGAQKITGEKSITLVGRDALGSKNTGQEIHDFGINNWRSYQAVGTHDYTYGHQLYEQLIHGFKNNYFGENPTGDKRLYSKVRNYDVYSSFLPGVIGHPLHLKKGDSWGQYLNTDLAEATGFGYGSACIGHGWRTERPYARYIGAAIGYWNYMHDKGWITEGEVPETNREVGDYMQGDPYDAEPIDWSDTGSGAGNNERDKAIYARIKAALDNGHANIVRYQDGAAYNGYGAFIANYFNQKDYNSNAFNEMTKNEPYKSAVKSPDHEGYWLYNFANTASGHAAAQKYGGVAAKPILINNINGDERITESVDPIYTDNPDFIGPKYYYNPLNEEGDGATTYTQAKPEEKSVDYVGNAINNLEKIWWRPFKGDNVKVKLNNPSRKTLEGLSHDELKKMLKEVRDTAKQQSLRGLHTKGDGSSQGIFYDSNDERDERSPSHWQHIIDYFGSGDTATYIPPIDDNAVSNALMYDEQYQKQQIVPYVIERDNGDQRRQELDELLNHTFNVRSDSIEALLTEMLSEMKKRKSNSKVSVPSEVSGNPPVDSLFDDTSIPTSIEKLMFG